MLATHALGRPLRLSLPKHTAYTAHTPYGVYGGRVPAHLLPCRIPPHSAPPNLLTPMSAWPHL